MNQKVIYRAISRVPSEDGSYQSYIGTREHICECIHGNVPSFSQTLTRQNKNGLPLHYMGYDIIVDGKENYRQYYIVNCSERNKWYKKYFEGTSEEIMEKLNICKPSFFNHLHNKKPIFKNGMYYKIEKGELKWIQHN